MAKQQGFHVAVKYFLPIDRKDFAKQAAAYGMMAAIGETQTLPAEFIEAAKVVSVSVRQGGYDDAAPATDEQIDTLGGAIDGALPKRRGKGAEASTE